MKTKSKIQLIVVCLLAAMSATAVADKMSTQLSSSAIAGYKQEMDRTEKMYAAGDVNKAMASWKAMAEKGYIPAQLKLGEILDYAEQDKEAIDWYLKAANQGDAAGQFSLGMMYISGEGGPADAKKGMPWVRKAADQNYLAAIKVLAEAYRKGRMGMAVDLEQAQFWERKIPASETAVKRK